MNFTIIKMIRRKWLTNPKNLNYLKVLDSLKLEIDLRIKGANAIPKGIGRQLEQESYKKAPNITPGDLYDKNGKEHILNQLMNRINKVFKDKKNFVHIFYCRLSRTK